MVAMSNWEWFKRWSDAPLKKRGDDYEEIKKTIGERCIERACKIFPQIRNHIDFVEIGCDAFLEFRGRFFFIKKLSRGWRANPGPFDFVIFSFHRRPFFSTKV
jgi:hypothetical protein